MPEETSIWGHVDYLVPRLSSSTRISVKILENVVSILFDDSEIELIAKGDGLETWWTTAFAIALEPGNHTQFVCQFRGAVRKTAASSAVLTASVNGQLITREFGYGTEFPDEKLLDDLDVYFDTSSLTNGRVLVVVALTAQRRDFDNWVRISCESVDQGVRIAPSAPSSASAPASAPSANPSSRTAG